MTLLEIMNALVIEPVPDLSTEQQFELLAIRNQQIVRESSYGRHIIENTEHLRWIEQLQTDPAVLFYAVKFEGEIIGGVGLRKINAIEKSAEWSFYVSQAAHGKGIGLALGILALDLFFYDLQLLKITGEALMTNPPSLSYHKKLGFNQVAQQQHVVQPGNQVADIAVFSLSASAWRVRRQQLCVEP